MRYLTPKRYRSLGLGIDLSSRVDADLAPVLDAASSLVNAYTAAPNGHDFRGGSVVDEEHIWDSGNAHVPGSGRIWPYHRPLSRVTRMRLYVTRTQYIEFDEENLFFNGKLGYVEPVGTPSTTALFTAIPPWGLTAEVAKLSYEYGELFPVTDDELITISGGDLQAANQFWDEDASVEITKNGIVMAGGDYSVDLLEGLITPTVPAGPTDIFRASYSHRLANPLSTATGLIATDLLGFSNINAAGLTGLSGIRVEEIELRQSSKVGFTVDSISPAAKVLLDRFRFASIA